VKVPEAGIAIARDEIERRSGYDRRALSLRTFFQGGLTPRRRSSRRHGEGHALVDWHEPHLLLLSVMILLLSVTDAFLTLTLMTHGATEANPLLAYVLTFFPELFAGVKLFLTGASILVLVALARARVFRIIRVTAIMHSCLAFYLALICYEWWMLRGIL
jgi:Domain of unknown function (DUF5658)